MSELLKIIRTDAKKRKDACEQLAQLENKLNKGIDEWRRSRVSRITKADWISEFRFWLHESSNTIDEKVANSGMNWETNQFSSYLRSVRELWMPRLATSSKEELRRITVELMNRCRKLRGAEEINEEFFQ